VRFPEPVRAKTKTNEALSYVAMAASR
jgi:hypothetical protein